MSTIIRYNGIDIFNGIGPVPFVSRNFEPIRYGKKFGAKEVFTLEGQITGSCSTSYLDILNKSTTLFNNLASDFKRFEIISNGVTVVDKPCAKVVSFDLDEDKTFSIKPYSITFDTFDDNNFSAGDFGVLDPSNEIQYSEGQNGELSITHSISARGFKTTKDPLQNAIDYVNTNSNLGSEILTSRINKNGAISSPVLVSVTEQVNRLESSYSLTKKYICDARRPNSGRIFNSSVDISYDEESGIYTADFSGSIQGGFNTGNLGSSNMDEIRDALKTLDFYAITNTNFKKKYDFDLNPIILNLKIDENEIERSISFSCSFNSDRGAGVAYMEADYTMSYDDVSELYQVSASISIKGKKSQKAKWADIKSFYENLNVQALCQNAVLQEDGSVRLEQYPNSFSVSFDERNSTITVDASFNQINPQNFWSNQFKNLDFSLELTASKDIILPVQTIYNGAKVIDIEAKTRPQISISGSLSPINPCSSTELYSSVKNLALSIIGKYLGSASGYFLESIEVSKEGNDSGQAYNFNISVSYDAGNFYLKAI